MTQRRNWKISASFEECWNEFRRRTFPRYAAFIQLFKEKYSSAFENATSILDIGAGTTVFLWKGDKDYYGPHQMIYPLGVHIVINLGWSVHCKSVTKLGICLKPKVIKEKIRRMVSRRFIFRGNNALSILLTRWNYFSGVNMLLFAWNTSLKPKTTTSVWNREINCTC